MVVVEVVVLEVVEVDDDSRRCGHDGCPTIADLNAQSLSRLYHSPSLVREMKSFSSIYSSLMSW